MKLHRGIPEVTYDIFKDTLWNGWCKHAFKEEEEAAFLWTYVHRVNGTVHGIWFRHSG